jgi:hypothetical protein
MLVDLSQKLRMANVIIATASHKDVLESVPGLTDVSPPPDGDMMN